MSAAAQVQQAIDAAVAPLRDQIADLVKRVEELEDRLSTPTAKAAPTPAKKAASASEGKGTTASAQSATAKGQAT
jgi:phage shock protein A